MDEHSEKQVDADDTNDTAALNLESEHQSADASPTGPNEGALEPPRQDLDGEAPETSALHGQEPTATDPDTIRFEVNGVLLGKACEDLRRNPPTPSRNNPTTPDIGTNLWTLLVLPDRLLIRSRNEHLTLVATVPLRAVVSNLPSHGLGLLFDSEKMLGLFLSEIRDGRVAKFSYGPTSGELRIRLGEADLRLAIGKWVEAKNPQIELPQLPLQSTIPPLVDLAHALRAVRPFSSRARDRLTGRETIEVDHGEVRAGSFSACIAYRSATLSNVSLKVSPEQNANLPSILGKLNHTSARWYADEQEVLISNERLHCHFSMPTRPSLDVSKIIKNCAGEVFALDSEALLDYTMQVEIALNSLVEPFVKLGFEPGEADAARLVLSTKSGNGWGKAEIKLRCDHAPVVTPPLELHVPVKLLCAVGQAAFGKTLRVSFTPKSLLFTFEEADSSTSIVLVARIPEKAKSRQGRTPSSHRAK